ncbi:hypothetical protein Xvie_04014 [Xenorhabdus vietnamensis]|uniref:DUF1090 domain-containing protein n=1 Tax=Xenorhabdus vietnamensis TaxID=351656 RepID=A0A1Y2S626_9GAMM|nr:DUF1090 family protein [Xenorhabdus vietnamensis]OTA14088.1 hypothetical protein Xvie_04014 [Xenorhabdus vietnamensis]
MMSKTVILSVLIVFNMSATYANQGKVGCDIKKNTLEKQLKYAQADKDERLIKGLTRTLENIKATCALEKRLKEQNKKSETVKDNLADNSSPLKQENNKSQFRKPTKNSTIKLIKEVQAKQK